MTRAGVKAYRRANPGSKLKTAVTGKVKPGSKAANRRKSYCARSLGQLKRSSAKTRNDPNSRIVRHVEDGNVMEPEQVLNNLKRALNRRIEALAISVTSEGLTIGNI